MSFLTPHRQEKTRLPSLVVLGQKAQRKLIDLLLNLA